MSKVKKTLWDFLGKIIRSKADVPEGFDFCDCCLAPSVIISGEGSTSISSYKGSTVFSQGVLVPILAKYKHAYSGYLVEIKGRGLLPFSVTPEHPILVREREKVRNGRYVYHSLKWKLARDLEVSKDCLVFPKLRVVLPHSCSKEEARLLGLYLAEGYSQIQKRKGGGIIGKVIFCFGKHEKELIKETQYLIEKAYKRKSWCSEKETGRDCIFASVEVAKKLHSDFGSGARTKKIPDFIMSSSPAIASEFCKYYLKGDGYIDKTGDLHFITSSKVLAIQLQKLLSKLNIWAPLCVRPPTRSLIGDRVVQARGDLYYISVNLHRERLGFSPKARKAMRNWIYEDEYNFYIPIRKLRLVPFAGDVFNFKTSNGTYEANNVLIHNCGKQWPKEDFHHVLIAGEGEVVLCEECTNRPPSSLSFYYRRQRIKEESNVNQ